ncbi:MAG: hypothetical protein E7499_03265 [Ruminococcus sp.]|nr:hypothetical protein [Ruminococcus sp.]
MSIKKLSKAFNIYSGEKPLSGALRLLYIGLLMYAVMMLFFVLMFSMTRDDDLEIKKVGNVFCPLSVMLINFIAIGTTPIEDKSFTFAKFVRTLPDSFNVYKNAYIAKTLLGFIVMIAFELIVFAVSELFTHHLMFGVSGIIISLSGIMIYNAVNEVISLIKNKIITAILFGAWSIGFMAAVFMSVYRLTDIVPVLLIAAAAIIFFVIGMAINFKKMKKEWVK